ncbi:MAG TPA: indole-3-glycerol phosphate synthase TrpC [Puia sp.]|nr:indole-3-glycerol phosphate synthase TrpC [Puia sp.]
MNILDSIIAYKREEVAGRKAAVPVSALEKSSFFYRPCFSLKAALRDEGSTGIIAEFKRRSPSKGVINDKAAVAEVTRGYAAGGAACLSVLTDQHFFGGSDADLVTARVNEIPILRKEFIIEEYQIVEARAIGADVVLLIAACLKPAEVRRLAVFARGLGLEVLLEIHGEDELDHICDETALVGVNNRDLKTFTVDIERSIRLSRRISAGKVLVAESGISHAETIMRMKAAGFRGFLIGESFMKEADPAAAFRQFVRQLQECERHSVEK